jgi:hypothetical protein
MNRFQILDTTPIQPQKFFNIDYWTSQNNALTPVVNSFSYHYWAYLVVFALLVMLAFMFRFYKGYFLDQKTVDLIKEDAELQNPIYQKLTFFENYFLVGAYLSAFFFLSRQTAISILSNRLFMLIMVGFYIVGFIMVARYWFGDKKIEESYFVNTHKKAK